MRWWLSPILAAASFVLALAAGNAREVELLAVLVAVLLACALALGCAFLGRAIAGGREKGALWATLGLALFFLYGHVFEEVVQHKWVLSFSRLHLLLGGAWILLLAGGTWLLRRSRRDLAALLRGVGVAFALICAVSTVRLLTRGGLGAELSPADVEERAAYAKAPPLAAEDAAHPDVYHIVLDGYARHDVLQRLYGFDNTPFLEALKQRGFYVAEQAAANYPMTFLSLASTLNMRYLEALIAEVGPESKDRGRTYPLIHDHLVGRIFQSRGYRYLHFDTNYGGTETSDIADERYSRLPRFLRGELASVLLRTTALKFIEPEVAGQHLFMFERLAQIPEVAGPTYTLAHFILPHNPYVFDAEGNVRRDVSQSLAFFIKTGGWKRKADYVAQLRYTNKRTLQAIDAIIEESRAGSKPPPIIVLHSDHGSASVATTKGGRKGDEWPRERMPILSAYLVPEAMRRRLYPTMTPVNSFRVVFSELFGLELPLLPDRSFCGWYSRPYRLFEVTELLSAAPVGESPKP